MTVVIGYVDTSNKKIIMAADTCICYSDYTTDRVSDKIHTVKVNISNPVKKRGRKPSVPQNMDTEDMLIGYAGSWSVIQSIRHNICMPEYSGQDLMDYMVRDVVPIIKDLAEIGESSTLSVLIGFKGKLFEIDESFSVTENFKSFTAIGSGVKHAMASLYSYSDMGLSPLDMVDKALNCTAEFVLNVKSPFTFHTINYK